MLLWLYISTSWLFRSWPPRHRHRPRAHSRDARGSASASAATATHAEVGELHARRAAPPARSSASPYPRKPLDKPCRSAIVSRTKQESVVARGAQRIQREAERQFP